MEIPREKVSPNFPGSPAMARDSRPNSGSCPAFNGVNSFRDASRQGESQIVNKVASERACNLRNGRVTST